jgi:phage terminase small subunit
MADLTAKQARFVAEYLIDLNATQAAIRAGYSAKTANREGSRLLSKVDIADAIAAMRAKIAKKVEVTVESLTVELEEARGIAIAEKQSSAAVAATMGKAKLFGLGVENRKLSGSLQIVTLTAKDLDGLTADELASLDAAYPVLQKLGLVGSDSGAAAEAGD